MQKALKEGPEIVVATPGRMIEMIKLKATSMQRCTMMVSVHSCIIAFTFSFGFSFAFSFVLRAFCIQLSYVFHSFFVRSSIRLFVSSFMYAWVHLFR